MKMDFHLDPGPAGEQPAESIRSCSRFLARDPRTQKLIVTGSLGAFKIERRAVHDGRVAGIQVDPPEPSVPVQFRRSYRECLVLILSGGYPELAGFESHIGTAELPSRAIEG